MDKNKEISRPNGKASRLQLIALCLAVVAALSSIGLIAIVYGYINDLMRAHGVSSSLRGAFEAQAEESGANLVHLTAFDREMRQINPHFIAWITIDGTPVNYPIVRGDDNEKYLDTSFYGEENIFGTLFMDYRNRGDFVPHIIIYGHNSREDRKFSSLHWFLDSNFLADHSTITLMVNGRIVEYEIFSVRLTDIHDSAYHLDFSYPNAFAAFLERINAPLDAEQIITLSTCVTTGNDDERLIVQGVLRN